MPLEESAGESLGALALAVAALGPAFQRVFSPPPLSSFFTVVAANIPHGVEVVSSPSVVGIDIVASGLIDLLNRRTGSSPPF